jgi:hypothetical protein
MKIPPEQAVNKISKYVAKAVNCPTLFLCHIIEALEHPPPNFSLPKPPILLQPKFTKCTSGHYRRNCRAVKIPISCVIEAGFVKFTYISLRESCSVLIIVN